MLILCSFRYEDDDLVPIRMNIMWFIVGLLSITILVLNIMVSLLMNSYWLKNIIHLSFSTEIHVFPLTFFWRIRPHVLIIDKNTQFSSRNNSHKLPLPYDGGSKISIDVINEANTLRDLVNEYLSFTVGSEIFLLNKFVRMTGGCFVTVISLVDNELFMTKYPPVSNTIIFNIDMKVNNNNGVWMKLQRQKR